MYVYLFTQQLRENFQFNVQKYGFKINEKQKCYLLKASRLVQ